MRVVAGSKKGREIIAPKGRHTRPTLAKVKEAMFGMAQFDIEGARVLDLFAGSGALGIEALSRGAEHAVFCDSDRAAAAIVRGNIKRLGLEANASVYCCDSIALLGELANDGKKFDLVLLDPPYETDLASRAVAELGKNGLLNDCAILLIEHSKENPPVITGEGFTAREPKKYGDCCVTYASYHLSE